MLQSLFYNRLPYIAPFRRGGAIKACEEEEDAMTELIMAVFIEQTLAFLGSAKNKE